MKIKNRKIGLDVLRIMAMLGIVGLHIINNGGILNNLNIYSYKYYVVLLLLTVLYTSVNLFAMMTGYLCVNRKSNRNARIVELIFIALFWPIAITIVFYIFNISNIRNMGIIELVKNILHAIIGKYWYITSYILLFFMIPYINFLIEKLSKSKLEKLLIILFILFCIIPNILLLTDLFKLENGYSPFWLIYCYMIGAYIKLYMDDKKTKTWEILLSLLGAFTFNAIFRNISFLLLGKIERSTWLISYISPFIVFASMQILIIFKDINLKDSKVNKIITYISSFSFSVYIIHTHRLIYSYILKDLFVFLNNYNGLVIILGIILCMIIIYLICMILDGFRKIFFKIFRINKIIEKIGLKLDNMLN